MSDYATAEVGQLVQFAGMWGGEGTLRVTAADGSRPPILDGEYRLTNGDQGSVSGVGWDPNLGPKTWRESPGAGAGAKVGKVAA